MSVATLSVRECVAMVTNQNVLRRERKRGMTTAAGDASCEIRADGESEKPTFIPTRLEASNSGKCSLGGC